MNNNSPSRVKPSSFLRKKILPVKIDMTPGTQELSNNSFKMIDLQGSSKTRQGSSFLGSSSNKSYSEERAGGEEWRGGRPLSRNNNDMIKDTEDDPANLNSPMEEAATRKLEYCKTQSYFEAPSVR